MTNKVQTPLRGLDHLVICVPGLAEGRSQMERLGFTTTPDAFHPFGTSNFLVQLDFFFLEMLSIADEGLIHEHGETVFSFPAFNRDFMARHGVGASMLVMDSQDEVADREEYLAAGLVPHDPFSFGRIAVLPDGSEVEVKFSMNFFTDERMPEAAFFACRQHHPAEIFWKPDYQRHANGATAIAEITLVAQNPAEFGDFFEKFSGATVVEEGKAICLETSRGHIVVTTPDLFLAAYGHAAPSLDNGPRLAGFSVKVADLGNTKQLLDKAGIAQRACGKGIAVAATECFGTVVAFEQGSSDI